MEHQDERPDLIAVDVDPALAELVAKFPLPEGVDDADMNQAEIAQALGTSVPTVSKWLRTEKMPMVREGGLGKEYVFRLSHCWAWKCARDRDDQSRRRHNDAQITMLTADYLGVDIENPMASMSAKDRAALASADIAHSKAMHMRRQLVQLDDMVDLLERLLGMVRDKIEAMPDVLERELSLKPEEVTKVQRIGTDLLNSLVEEIEEAELQEREVADVEVQRQWMV